MLMDQWKNIVQQKIDLEKQQLAHQQAQVARQRQDSGQEGELAQSAATEQKLQEDEINQIISKDAILFRVKYL